CCSLPALRDLPSFPTRRSSDLAQFPIAPDIVAGHAIGGEAFLEPGSAPGAVDGPDPVERGDGGTGRIHDVAVDAFTHDLGNGSRSEEHTSELQSRENLVCRLLL